MKVKICGLTNLKDAATACELGADLAGFIFIQESPRLIDKFIAKEIIGNLPSGVGKVGLFRNHRADEVVEHVDFCGLDHVQIHGDETPEYCLRLRELLRKQGREIKIIKSFKVSDRIHGLSPAEYFDVDYYLFDTYHPAMSGGTGQTFDWEVLKDLKAARPFFLAGGLNPQNIIEAIQKLRPYGVDVTSGVERSPGKKDDEKMKEFIKNAKKA